MPLFHVWFATKYRRWLLEGDLAELVEAKVRMVAAEAGIRLLECQSAIDHVHVLLDLPAADALADAMRRLKGKSAYLVFREIPDLKLDAGSNHLWQRGYGWKIVEPGAGTISTSVH